MANWVALTDAAIDREVRRRLKQLRLDQNRTQAWLATQTGLARTTISRIENGSGPLSLLHLVQILRALRYLNLFEQLPESRLISPLKLAKLEIERRQRASPTPAEPIKPPSEW